MLSIFRFWLRNKPLTVVINALHHCFNEGEEEGVRVKQG